MPQLETKHFGSIAYEPESVVSFPAGLPGFEDRHGFVGLRFAETDPLIFLQSVDDGAICFITMPILVVDPGYRLEMQAEEMATLGLEAGWQPEIGADVLCLAVLSIREDGPTANLLAPVVVNLQNRLGVQAVSAESRYSHQHRLFREEAAVCS